MRGTIKLPPGVDKPPPATGKVRLKIKKGTKTMLNRTTPVKLKKGKCRFAKTVFLQRSKVGKTRAPEAQVRFLGNAVLKAGSVDQDADVRK